MKKFILILLSMVTINAFADIRVENPPRPTNIFGGIIRAAIYYPDAEKLRVNIENEYEGQTETLYLVFTGKDLPMGAPLLNAIGKSIIVTFTSRTSFYIKYFFTYDPTKQVSFEKMKEY
jgi:hypothetical protein